MKRSNTFLLTGFFFAMTLSLAHATAIVLPQSSVVDGKTIGDWTADWWQWAFSQSMPYDAFTDITGEYANIGQSDSVFFLAGTTGGTVERTFSVPVDKYILLPLLNVAVSEVSLGGSATETELINYAAYVVGSVDSLFAEIDGMVIPDLFSYREVSPFFTFYAATDNPFYHPPGASGNAVSDGYWLMLEPLGAGEHTIRFGGATGNTFSVDVTDHLAAAPIPEPGTLLLLASGLVGIAGYGRKRRKA